MTPSDFSSFEMGSDAPAIETVVGWPSYRSRVCTALN